MVDRGIAPMAADLARRSAVEALECFETDERQHNCGGGDGYAATAPGRPVPVGDETCECDADQRQAEWNDGKHESPIEPGHRRRKEEEAHERQRGECGREQQLPTLA